jgi:hypothetical protein
MTQNSISLIQRDISRLTLLNRGYRVLPLTEFACPIKVKRRAILKMLHIKK